MKRTLQRQQTEKHASLLQAGNERGLAFFYRRFYSYLFARAFRATQDDCAASSIAQESLLRLWLFREQAKCEETILTFLKAQVRAAIDTFFRKTRNRFHRSLLRLDGIEDYQEFMLGYEMEEDEDEDTVYLDQLESEKKQQLEKLNSLLPNLDERQQLFIRLCLKYDFSYERVAYHLGGISDYEVAHRMEQCIANLKAALSGTARLDSATPAKPIVAEGMLTEEQVQVFAMRYDLQYSFEEIAAALNLDDAKVKSLFLQAHAAIRKSKKSA